METPFSSGTRGFNHLIKQTSIKKQHIKAIGCHGQTLWHQPTGEHPFSLQLGNANIISELTGITIEPKESEKYYFYIKGAEVGSFEGKMILSDGVSEEISVVINVTNESLNPLYLIELTPIKKSFYVSKSVEFKLDITKLDNMKI